MSSNTIQLAMLSGWEGCYIPIIGVYELTYVDEGRWGFSPSVLWEAYLGSCSLFRGKMASGLADNRSLKVSNI